MLANLFRHFSNYSLGKLLILFAGLISFPLLTRLLAVDQYGMMSLVSTTLTFLVAFGKMGLQHSAMRFYSDTLETSSPYTFSQFTSTTFYGISLLALLVSMAWLLFNYAVPDEFWGDVQLKWLFMITSGLIFLRVVVSVFLNIMSAKEKSGFVSIYQVLYRYSILIMAVIVLLFISQTVLGVFVGQLVVDVVALLILMGLLFKSFDIRFSNTSWPLFKSMMIFGLPMFGFEVAGTALNVGDRYVIQWLKGAESLGVYAANYNLCEYAKNVVTSAVGMSVLPMYLRIHAEQGEAAARHFIGRSVHMYGLLAFPVVAIIAATGEGLVSLLASERYVEGAVVIPYVMSGMVVSGAMIMLAPGLFIKKQSILLMCLVAATAVINVVLNIVLIPIFGIEGAGMATLLSFVVFGVVGYWIGRKYFKITIPLLKLLSTLLAAIIMYCVMSVIEMDVLWMEILIQGLVGMSVFSAAVLIMDSEVRRLCLVLYEKCHHRLKG